MNRKCYVCNEPAAGFHFGAFTCEGCKVRDELSIIRLHDKIRIRCYGLCDMTLTIRTTMSRHTLYLCCALHNICDANSIDL